MLRRALITEKTMRDAGVGAYSFIVDKRASKMDIKRQIEKSFSVNVVSISTVTQKGKTQRSGVRRLERTLPSYKKAVVKLKDGQKIGLFELGESK